MLLVKNGSEAWWCKKEYRPGQETTDVQFYTASRSFLPCRSHPRTVTYPASWCRMRLFPCLKLRAALRLLSCLVVIVRNLGDPTHMRDAKEMKRRGHQASVVHFMGNRWVFPFRWIRPGARAIFLRDGDEALGGWLTNLNLLKVMELPEKLGETMPLGSSLDLVQVPCHV